jgi:hypothetical protein
MSHSTLIIYFSLFHSVMIYGIISWGNSSHSQKIFKIQKRAIRIIMGHKSRNSCRNLFKKLEILPIKSQYIFSLILFVVNNRDLFTINSENQSIQTRQMPMANLTIYQQGVHYSGVKIFNNLPLEIKNIVGNSKKFKQVFRKFLNTHSFYTLEEFYKTRYITLHSDRIDHNYFQGLLVFTNSIQWNLVASFPLLSFSRIYHLPYLVPELAPYK